MAASTGAAPPDSCRAATGRVDSQSSDFDATGKLVATTSVTEISDAFGTKRISTTDVNGDGSVDRTETLSVDSAGAMTSTVVSNAEARKAEYLAGGQAHWLKAIAAETRTTQSADGLTRTVLNDYDGNGTFETVIVARRQIDGSSVATITEKNANGSIKASGTLTVSSDGRTTILNKDVDNDGDFDQTQTSVMHNDGSLLLTVVERNGNGTLKETVTERFSATGKLEHRLTRDALGRKTAELIVNADGSMTALTFNATGGQTLSVSQLSKAGVLTSATLYDPLNAQGWSRVEQAFDALGRKIGENQFGDDGSRINISFDAATGQQISVNFFNTAGQLTAHTGYDFSNANPWAKYEQQFDWAGRVTYQLNSNDDGTKVAYTYDQAGAQTYWTVTQVFDVYGRLTVQYNANDNGSQDHYGWDVNNTSDRSWWAVHYDVYGRQEAATIFYDDGRRDDNGWDINNTSSISWWGTHYDGNGRLVNQDVFYDDGGRDANGWDAYNTSAYSWWGTHYDPNGRLTNQTVFYDAGGRDENGYDAYNTSSFSWWGIHYDGNGQRTNDTYFYDNGERSTISWDPYNSQAWSRVDNVYNSAGTRTFSVEYYDDGTRRETTYNSNGSVKEWIRYDRQGNVSSRGPWEGGNHPVLLDLNGDAHIDLRPFDPAEFANNTSPLFNWDADDVKDGTAWVGPQDGFLAIDLGTGGQAGPDGLIDQARELAFSLWPTDEEIAERGSVTDLEGLRLAFDTNHDNALDSQDARWNEFRVWQDINQDGVTDQGELRTMSEAGIRLVNLLPSSQGAAQFADGSAITGTSSYEMTDGTTRLVGDATLAFRSSVSANNAA
ncbi:hypothetical protein [Phyllobacterium zundukense]|uniref:Uncharacterized protein n=1 Tax=Phyllobacterium zundukense TaxID=1867719 RepID=A0ACD4CX19_9HYPH|nr:hypothetical protein [Phyllobacterium zundukense]UXN58135.1 hypothetical protein N8E88_04745 [Phyllobacterium zundukense]